MATTVGNFSAIDDSEVDAESPITETLVTRLRDNSYWIDAGTRQTTQTSTTRVLTPDGSGGVAWVEANTIAGVDGTKGGIQPVSASSGSPDQITIQNNKKLFIYLNTDAICAIDASDDTFSGLNLSTLSHLSGTITGSFGAVYTNLVPNNLLCKKNGANYEFYFSASNTFILRYFWL